jgi:hypothetical protein
VWDAREQRVDDGKGGVDLNDLDRLSLIARLRPLGRGTYTVRYKAVSTPDLAARRGTFRFTVAGAASTLPPLKIVSPLDGAVVSGPVMVVFETAADLSQMTMGPHAMKQGAVHLHIDLDKRLIMPTMKQITRLGPQRYRVGLGAAAPGAHTIRLFWADARHRPLGPVQQVAIMVK